MRRRILGSVLVVVVGLVPLFVGGPVFALLMLLLGVAGYREFLALVARVNPSGVGSNLRAGYLVVVALACSPLVDQSATSLLLPILLAVVSPLVLLFRAPMQPGGFAGWALACTGSLYLGIPIYAAVSARSIPGAIDAQWLNEAARSFAVAWDPAARGLAWVLTMVLATWVGDSAALLVGKSFGQLRLAPAISPNKSLEGATGGLVASMAVGAVSFQLFGLGDWQMGLVAGVVIGLAGQIGDLAESVLKRQAGVKDSGSIIPGHGGILDRIDALLFAFPAGYLMAVSLHRFGT